MKLHPLILTTHDVQAILAGNKTRYTVPAPIPNHDHFGINIMDWPLSKHPYLWRNGDREEWRYHVQTYVDSSHSFNLKSPYGFAGDKEWQTGMPPEEGMYWVIGHNTPIFMSKSEGEPYFRWKRTGSILYSKEAWKIEGSMSHGQSVLGVVYKADGKWIQNDSPEIFNAFYNGRTDRWQSPVTMPREASRIFLEVTDVVCKQVQKITEEEAKAEGISCLSKDGGRTYKYGIADLDGMPGNDDIGWHWKEWEIDYKAAFKKVYSKRHGPDSWNNNDWVFSCNWKVLSTTGKPNYL